MHEARSWIWVTVQGAFNEKASLTQIFVDALVGMIPLVGDATAVRDLIAVLIGMVDDPKKRTDKWQGILLVVLLFALIPVFGGAIKGVGRILVKAGIEASHLAPLARAAHLQEAAREMIALLNRIGHGHAEKWLLRLNPIDHQAALLDRFNALMYTINGTLVSIERKLGGVLSPGIRQRIEGLKTGFDQLAAAGRQLIPAWVKDAGGNPKRTAKFWGLGAEPRNAEEWRKFDGGVLDEWNHDGYILTGTVQKSGEVKACTGKIAEQRGEEIPGQYLPGGGRQAMVETPSSLTVELNALAEKVMADGQSRSVSAGGFDWHLRPTGWTDVNGVHGYGLVTGHALVQTLRLGARERATKTSHYEPQGAN